MSASSPPPVQHLVSVVVEDFFHAHVFERVVPRSSWDAQPRRVEAATMTLLDLLAAHDVHGTFFTLGWVAERHPGLVRAIAAAGHELASHTWWHPKITTLTPAAFRDELRTSKAILEDTAGQRVIGFRAPSFSIRPGMDWAFDALLEEGYRYDSSLFPIRRPDYGWPGAPVVWHQIHRPNGSLYEFPLATLSWFGVRLPAAGGGYLRHLPFAVIRGAFAACERGGTPGMFYIHPWDLDQDQPRLPLPLLGRVRHYRGLGRARPRLERLLREFRFTSVARFLDGRLD
ncbi:MAG: XrtA system polysaccharide deacetylase [Candidatus Rokuibacteriota bacterium]